jgi:hypothetical protein
MRILLAATLASLATLSALPASANPSRAADASKMATDDCARARKAGKDCVLSMDAHEVGGDTPRSTGLSVVVLNPTKQPSLIRVRRDFIPEILKSAEDL